MQTARSTRLTALLLSALLAGGLTASAEAQSTLRVPSDLPTIQAALDAAAPGDTVLIEPGQYAVNQLDTLGKQLTLRGEQGADQTVLDGGLLGPILQVQNGEGAELRIEGLTFFRGLAPTGGGVVTVSGNASPVIADCVFDRNAALGQAAVVQVVGQARVALSGAEFIANETRCLEVASPKETTVSQSDFRANAQTLVALENEASLRLEGCLFEGNTGVTAIEDSGQGVTAVTLVDCTFRADLGQVDLNVTDSVLIEDCLFEERPPSPSGAVAIGGSATALAVRRTTFRSNRSQTFPAAMTVASLASVTIEDCLFEDNHNEGGAVSGGAVAVAGSGSGVVRRCRFVGNSSNQSAGALHLSGNTRVENCVFLGNSASSGGGALLSVGLDNSLDHCTFVGNTSAAGGAVFGSGLLKVRSSVFWQNSPGSIAVSGAPVDVAYSLVEGGYPGTGNLDTDPLFAPSSELDFHLSISSPCRNAGAPGAPLPATDLDGDPRLLDGAVDMGADEVFEQPFVGTAEDLQLTSRVDGSGDPLAATKQAPEGSLLTLWLDSPAAAFADASFLLMVDFAATGVALPPPSIPGLDLNPFSPQFTVLFNSALVLPQFGGLPLGPEGFTLNVAVPGGLAGLSLYAQGAAFSASAGNGVYAVSNAHQIVF